MKKFLLRNASPVTCVALVRLVHIAVNFPDVMTTGHKNADSLFEMVFDKINGDKLARMKICERTLSKPNPLFGYIFRVLPADQDHQFEIDKWSR